MVMKKRTSKTTGKAANLLPGIHQVPLSTVLQWETVRVRSCLSAMVAAEYAEVMKEAGEYGEFPPVVAFITDGKTILLGDGLHRREAALLAKLAEITVEIREGTEEDAILFAVSANRKHGLRPSESDRAIAVKLILSRPCWQTASTKWISEVTGTSQAFVRKIRGGQPEKIVGKDGVVRQGTLAAKNQFRVSSVEFVQDSEIRRVHLTTTSFVEAERLAKSLLSEGKRITIEGSPCEVELTRGETCE